MQLFTCVMRKIIVRLVVVVFFALSRGGLIKSTDDEISTAATVTFWFVLWEEQIKKKTLTYCCLPFMK